MAHLVLRFSEQVERVAEAVVVGLVGVLLLVLPVPASALWLAPLLFVVIRPAAVLLTLAPLRPAPREALLAAWFGIRGVGSVYYLAFALVSGTLAAEDAVEVTGLVLAVVAASIVVHGISVTPLMTLRARAARAGGRPRGSANLSRHTPGAWRAAPASAGVHAARYPFRRFQPHSGARRPVSTTAIGPSLEVHATP